MTNELTTTNTPATTDDELTTDMWLKCTALSSDNVGDTARVAGLPTVLRVRCWDGQRFAWIAVGEMITLKVWEGSELSHRLNLTWLPRFQNPIKTVSIPVVVEGTIHTLADGTLTMHHAKVIAVQHSDDDQSKGLAWVIAAAFETTYAKATGDPGFLKGELAMAASDPVLAPMAEKLKSKILSNNPTVAALLTE